MAQDSIYKGTNALIGEINLTAVQHDPGCCISPKDTYCCTSYDLGPTRIVVPASPPTWTPQALPIAISPDEKQTDPRTVLPSCPLDPLLRAASITCPQLDVKEIDLISDRKNLRALFDFVNGRLGRKGHRIDAEVINGTVLFFLGWSGRQYSSAGFSGPQYGMNFEKSFTGPLSEGTIQHNRVVNYTLGSLNMIVKYQVDACIQPHIPSTRTTQEIVDDSPVVVTPSGLRVISRGTLVDPESIVEIKTLRTGGNPTKPQTMAQLWFSQTSILAAGFHDGTGQFSSVRSMNVKASGALDRWEGRNRETLQKVVRLIEMIKEYMISSPVRKQGIVLTKEDSGSIVRFYSVHESYNIGLTDDLRAKWT